MQRTRNVSCWNVRLVQKPNWPWPVCLQPLGYWVQDSFKKWPLERRPPNLRPMMETPPCSLTRLKVKRLSWPPTCPKKFRRRKSWTFWSKKATKMPYWSVISNPQQQTLYSQMRSWQQPLLPTRMLAEDLATKWSPADSGPLLRRASQRVVESLWRVSSRRDMALRGRVCNRGSWSHDADSATKWDIGRQSVPFEMMQETMRPDRLRHQHRLCRSLPKLTSPRRWAWNFCSCHWWPKPQLM